VAEIVSLGPTVLDNLNALIRTMQFDNDPIALSQLYDAREALLGSQLYLERFLLTNEAEAFETSRKRTKLAQDRLAVFTVSVRKKDRAGPAEEILELVGQYWAAAEGAYGAISDRNVLRDKVGTLSGILLGDIVTIVGIGRDRQASLTAATDQTRIWSLVFAVVISAAAIAASLILARRVTSSVTSGIEQTVAELSAVAEGDHDVEISRTDADTEMGEIARTLLVFRDNAKATEALREEQRRAEIVRQDEERQRQQEALKADADRQAKIEAERARTINELSASVGSVVDAAARGDFSRKIDHSFDEPELQNIAASLNTLIESIDTGLSSTARVLARLASGDLTRTMDGTFSGQFAELQSSMNGTVSQLSMMVREIKQQSAQLGDNAAHMTDQSLELSRRAEQQAASLEESSAALEQISATVQSSAEGAKRAMSVADNASSRVEAAGKVMADAEQAMADIQGASQRIGEIVGVIDGIAFQTNLLALNASVEAARAGSAGKGFAVVATEVRALAQRSSEASQDIKQLIDETAEQVSRGVKLVKATGETLEDIVEGVGGMATTLKDMTVGAAEQAAGVREVSSAISDLDGITQKNASLSDASRESARALKAQAETLQALMATFQVAGAPGSPATDAAPDQAAA
jgi:methyl-accepting chemotaxis protein